MQFFKLGVILIVIYLCGAFVSGGFNPESWNAFWKLVLVACGVVAAVFTLERHL